MWELIPVEMRAMSVLSAILFFFGGVILLFLHRRVNKIDNVVFDKSLDIEKLTEMCANTEKAVESIKEDNRMMIGLVREDNKVNLSRIEKSLAEIRGRLYGSD